MVDYIILAIYILLFTIICLFGVIMVVYIVLKPFKEYFIAKLKGKDCMFIIQKDGRIAMIAATFWDSVYGHKPSPPWSYLRKDATLYRLGGVKCVPIVDNWNITKDCDLRDNVEKLKDYGIDNYEQMRNQIEKETRQLAETHITGDGAAEMLLSNKPFMQNAFEIVDFDRLMEYIDSIFPVEINSHIDKEISNFLNTFVLNKNKGINWTLIILLLAIVGGVIIMGALGAKVLGLW